MAASRVGKTGLALLLLFLSCAAAQLRVDEAPVNVPFSSVSSLLVQSALSSLNENSPSRHTYRNGDLISAQKLTQPPYVIYRLTLNLEPVCKSSEENCAREACTLVVRQHEQGVIDVLHDSIQCMELQPQSKQQNAQDQEVIENIEKQIINQSISLDHEVQTSADHNDRPFIAVRATQSEYCPGCPYELNPSLPGLSAFGNQVMQSMDEAGVSDFKHKLISIVRVTRAVPPGANVVQYQLLVEIGESNCLRTSLIEIAECPLQSNLPIKLCLVTFEERPWQSGSRKITRNNCTDLLNTDNEVSASVDPKSPLFESAAPYREDDVSTKTEFYDQIAQEAQEVFRVPYMDVSTKDSVVVAENTDAAKELPHSKIILDRVEEKEKPSKFAEKMKEFDEFLEDFNIPIRLETTSPKYQGVPVTEEFIIAERVEDKKAEEQTTDNKPLKQTDDDIVDAEQTESLVQNPTVETVVRSKRSSGKALDSKLTSRKLAVKAVELLDDLDEDDKRKHVIDVIDSRRERQDKDNSNVVIYMTVEVAATDCSEKDQGTECLDEVLPGPTQICKLDISTNEKKPLQSPKLLHWSCRNKQKSEMRYKRQLVGAPTSHSKDDPEVQRYVQLGLEKYTENYQGTNQPMISNIKDVSVQVVSGLLYKIQTDIGVSTCSKGTVTGDCQLSKDHGVEECVIEAWSQPWLDKGNPKITVKCGQNRSKRSLRGQNYSQKMLQQSRQLKEEILFHEFMGKYKKMYHNKEEKEMRFQIFKDNLNLIEELQRNEMGTGRYGVTQFTDLTKAEFKARHLGLKPTLKSENDIPMPMATIPDIELPSDYDWRHHNVVTPVKDQGSCGSCWAFSVTGNIEGQYAIKHGELLSLSEQELVDCDKLDSGCNGGLPDTAYRAIEELGGLELESDYPYDAEDEKCHFNKNKVKVNIVSGLNITSNETQMAQWLVKNGPMSIGINANAMQFYMGGVSHPFKFLCSPDSLDHGVLIVGYGVKFYPIFKKTMPYWIIKNSWGPRWGEQGYYRVYRGDGTCGVNKMVTSAVVA
ncbi:uncharacterized protein LOC100123649 [Nasonia vitripennis]|uniref:Cysteine proteinase CG12163 n=1 Tax=Nasonia vitripennis TaxID=7425 RepID=A0A7M7G8P9_NASVI|nr:uncharacterized protein LOC100123649 [Nasonia vitripennis]